MNRSKIFTTLVIVLLIATFSFWIFSLDSYQPPYITERLQNFKLQDQHGKLISLYDYSHFKAVILFSYNIGCHTIPRTIRLINEIKKKYYSEEVAIIGIDPNIQDSIEDIVAENITFPILIDRDQSISRALGMTRAAESFLIDTKNWRAVYHGAVTDPGPNTGNTGKYFLAEAVDDFIQRRKIEIQENQSLGCAITFLEKN